MIIKENIWMLKASSAMGQRPGFHCYLIKDAQGLTLIDSSLPGRGDDILREIKQIGFQASDLKRILLTHGDMDHIGNAPMLQKATGCKVYASEEEVLLITGQMRRAEMKEKLFQSSGFIPPEMSVLPEELEEYQIIPSPGHTTGHVCYLYQKVLFAGDCCTTESGTLEGPDPKFTENLVLAEKSYRQVLKYAFDWICPGHGNPVQV